jgi:predicted Zn-dependent protease
VTRRAVILCLTVAFAGSAAERHSGDWSGGYHLCDGHTELFKSDHMSLGVRFATSKSQVATAFAEAMNFWAHVLDMEWHTENGRECAIQVVDGHGGLFTSAQSARAQFPTARSFQGWIAFNPKMTLPANELFTTAVHEIGHLLGLPHSANPSSVMYFFYLDGPVCLDSADISYLTAHHKLRTQVPVCPVR